MARIMYQIIWSDNAELSFNDEIIFISKKWNNDEVLKFISLVDQTIIRLSTGTLTGVIKKKNNICKLVISKQTTLYYKQNFEQKHIELLLFWNNKKDPNELKYLLKN